MGDGAAPEPPRPAVLVSWIAMVGSSRRLLVSIRQPAFRVPLPHIRGIGRRGSLPSDRARCRTRRQGWPSDLAPQRAARAGLHTAAAGPVPIGGCAARPRLPTIVATQPRWPGYHLAPIHPFG